MDTNPKQENVRDGGCFRVRRSSVLAASTTAGQFRHGDSEGDEGHRRLEGRARDTT